MRDLRRLVSTVVIVCFSVAALLGIAALLGGGSFGETEARVLGTTLVIGLQSVAALCYLALAGHRYAAVGLAGGASSLVASGIALWATWGDGVPDGAWRTFGVAVTVAASLAQASLLIALVRRRSLRAALAATLLAIAAVALMVIYPIVAEPELDDGYWRLLGVLAILDVLGTVVLMALGLFRGRQPEAAAPATLAAPVQARLVATARDLGTTPSQLVSDALDAFVARR
ncbi:hypothetical protein GON03_02380 [Nocardioides sp. MAH-18]|uniref:Uncharacterized protein n=1 Tax=Nocardioides agri TaxID=2682843 RepID=A0A6L6XLP8_9ACTN|nr:MULTISPECIES: hypothetical protein [unclassified Nocardioides]MBA2953141.1 hypothetical protein [Nocardioides sp. CGMCC 1.13656]MVQ48010.1 hypothetical protein [Nocardioides sp. MAH-18]